MAPGRLHDVDHLWCEKMHAVMSVGGETVVSCFRLQIA
ncbi:hypothetical protein NTGZN8_60076 [Candidatus Nitrotoga fabula]|uniref:Uncharacterized protein n=1 Tax=Candidatus Nitrotoga fabula TaxID=2182327 RepID=A0A916BHQ6_9PROT|nr:hypothetical protein NTGZN8_60076 [Candidatus Nitrotoga fabula]